ncbi:MULTISPECIES: UxaA family hydrolase [unclassified Microbulbifer]|uniref:UxaA family hydrolase n=1 Tax=unclassified Microbulbifer TaxID=2619833 RepID=UPI0027E57360|nr:MULTISPECIES: UxaA family hydrolase [unclassified Microbulbifer]
MKGYLRADGRKGIRNVLLVTYLVECAHHVARTIVTRADSDSIQLIGFPGCYPNDYSLKIMEQLCTHPNVGGVVIVSLGCEGFNRERLSKTVSESGRPVSTFVIQESGGTRQTVEAGLQAVGEIQREIANAPMVDMGVEELVVGTICGGSDGTSGISANPAVGSCFDMLVDRGAACIFEETGELIGCEQIMADRAVTPELGREIIEAVQKAENYYRVMGYGSFAPGNAEGGLTTLEEKSMGAYAKSGASQIHGMIKPGDIPPRGGLYLMDVVPDGDPLFGFPNIVDSAEIVEMIASGAHIILFTTGRGSVVGSAISPVIKVCANPETYRKMADDMDINAGKVIEGRAAVASVGEEIYQLVCNVAGGEKTKSEALGHQEFVLTYKQFEPIGPACLPRR